MQLLLEKGHPPAERVHTINASHCTPPSDGADKDRITSKEHEATVRPEYSFVTPGEATDLQGYYARFKSLRFFFSLFWCFVCKLHQWDQAYACIKQQPVESICISLSLQITFSRCVCWRTPRDSGLVLVGRKTFPRNLWAPAWCGLKNCFPASQQQRAAVSTWVMSSWESTRLLWRDSHNMSVGKHLALVLLKYVVVARKQNLFKIVCHLGGDISLTGGRTGGDSAPL